LRLSAGSTGERYEDACPEINMRKVDGWKTLTAKLIDHQLALAA
jgi:hypothetical protein